MRTRRSLLGFERLRVLRMPLVPSCVNLNAISRAGYGRFISKAQMLSPTDDLTRGAEPIEGDPARAGDLAASSEGHRDQRL